MDSEIEGEQEISPPQDDNEISKNINEEQTTAIDLLTVVTQPAPANQLEQTLGIIKPDAMDKAEEIIKVIQREGLSVLQMRRVKLSKEQATSFYQDMYSAPWFDGCVENLSSGPLLALVLSGPNAVRHWNELVGPSSWEERSQHPKCLRNRYGTSGDDHKNGLHAPPTSADALRELHFFFPELIVEPTIATNLASQYLNQNVHPVLTVGLSKLVRERPDDPVMWLADWLLANNPNKPKEQGANMTQRAGKCK